MTTAPSYKNRARSWRPRREQFETGGSVSTLIKFRMATHCALMKNILLGET